MLRKLLAPSSTRLLALLIVVSASAAFAQTETAARITQPIDDSARVTLKGNVPLIARAQNDRGQAPVSTPYTGMRLVLQRSPRQEAALQQYLSELQDKSSPNYHKWLTPEQFGKLYGPADADIQKLTAWLEGHGFQVTSVPTGRTTIAFSGTIGQAQDAFSVEIHSFETKTEQFFSNTTDPQIPVALSGVVSGIAGLNTIKPKSQAIRGPGARFDPKAKRITRIPPSESVIKPQLTLYDPNLNPYLFLGPADAATIYDTPNTKLNVAYTSGTTYDGTGVKIGVAGDSNVTLSALANYRILFGLPANAPTVNVVQTDPGINGDELEALLDLEVSGALAPNAKITFYVDESLTEAMSQAVNDNTVSILNVSFGACEANLGTARNSFINSLWQQAAMQGMSVTISTGDAGSAACDDQNTETSAVSGLAVNGLASTPYNIAVGGTDYDILNSAFSSYADAADNGTPPYYRTALKYIPENPWNDSSASDSAGDPPTTIANNIPFVDGNNNTFIFAAGGGASSCLNGTVNTTTGAQTGCTQKYPKPFWQTGSGVPNDSARDIPDVSLMAGDTSWFATWTVCADAASSASGTDDCVLVNGQLADTTSFSGVGGTSASSPAFAGMLALVVQKYGRQGQAAEVLYDLYNGSHKSTVFHDVTIGNNSVPCDTGTSGCKNNTAGFPYMTGYNAGTGYDLASGLGSVDVNQLITYWNTATGPLKATVTVTPALTTISAGDTLKVTVKVAPPSGDATPTGSITLSSGTYTSSATALSSGSATITIPANKLATGSDKLTASYSGDVNYGTATGTATVTVTPPGSIGVAANPTSLTFTAGASTGNTSKITVNPAGGYTGTVKLSCAVTGGPSGAVLPTCALANSSVSITGAAVSTTLTVTTDTASSELQWPVYPGRWYSAAGGAALACILLFGIPARRRAWKNMLGVVCAFVALSFTGIAIGCGGGGGGGGGTTKTTPTVTVTPAKTAINVGDSLGVAISVSGGSTTPTGSVTLSGGGYTSAATTLTSGAVTITIPANKLSVGSDTLTASYSGDGNFNSGTGTASVTVSKPGTTAGTYTIKITATDSTFSTITASTNVSVTVN